MEGIGTDSGATGTDGSSTSSLSDPFKSMLLLAIFFYLNSFNFHPLLSLLVGEKKTILAMFPSESKSYLSRC
ncbi:hypothetical protein C0J52_12109 [Blattella germanica]|nr:hypothetical protein C0J52_12109 [Blattella germanica]